VNRKSYWKNFLGVPENYSTLENSGVVVLPVPYEMTTSYKKGTHAGPYAILSASQQVEYYDSDFDCEPYKAGIFTMPPLPVENVLPEDMLLEVECAARDILEAKKLPLVLGGEHSISLGVLRAIKSYYSDVSVIVIDAHSDLRDEYHGSPYNHACVSCRMAELAPVIQIGIRSMEESKTISQDKINTTIFYPKDLSENNWLDRVASLCSNNVYISVDVDGLDPGVCPGTGTPEPGGLSWEQINMLFEKVSNQSTIIGADIVELAPVKNQHRSDFLVAKLAYKMIGYLVCSCV
jgi:agmatinase